MNDAFNNILEGFPDGGISLCKSANSRQYLSRIVAHTIAYENGAHGFLSVGELMAIYDSVGNALSPEMKTSLQKVANLKQLPAHIKTFGKEYEKRMMAIADAYKINIGNGGDRETMSWQNEIPAGVLSKMVIAYKLGVGASNISHSSFPALSSELSQKIDMESAVRGNWGDSLKDSTIAEEIKKLPRKKKSEHQAPVRGSFSQSISLLPRWDKEKKQGYAEFFFDHPMGEYAIRDNYKKWVEIYGKTGVVDDLAMASIDGLHYSMYHYMPVRPSKETEKGWGYGAQLGLMLEEAPIKFDTLPLTSAVKTGVKKFVLNFIRENTGVKVSERAWMYAQRLKDIGNDYRNNGGDYETGIRLNASKIAREIGFSETNKETQNEVKSAIVIALNEGAIVSPIDQCIPQRNVSHLRSEAEKEDAAYIEEDDVTIPDPFVSNSVSIKTLSIIQHHLEGLVQCVHGSDVLGATALVDLAQKRGSALNESAIDKYRQKLVDQGKVQSARSLTAIKEIMENAPPLKKEEIPSVGEILTKPIVKEKLIDRLLSTIEEGGMARPLDLEMKINFKSTQTKNIDR